jgi:hypothetical protein
MYFRGKSHGSFKKTPFLHTTFYFPDIDSVSVCYTIIDWAIKVVAAFVHISS